MPTSTTQDATNDAEPDACSICLHAFNDRTIIPTCAHEFCFDCILEWTEQSRKCPLCNQEIGEYLIHRIRGKYDYQRRYIVVQDAHTAPGPSRRVRRERVHREEADRLEQSIEMRRAVYDWGLYAKHVASNAFTKYRPYPTPSQFSASPDLIRRTTMFLRRELRVWPNLDVEFLTTFTISIIKSIDIRSQSAVKLIAEFLDPDGGQDNAEHFAHEVYTYVRSPFNDLFVYDTVVQYDDPPERDSRWIQPTPTSPRQRSRSPRRRSRSHSPTRKRTPRSDTSWSPSGRTYPSTRIHSPKGKEKAPSPKRQKRTSSPHTRRISASPHRHRRSSSPHLPLPLDLDTPPLPLDTPPLPLPDRPKRPPRSALDSLHAHLKVKGKGREDPLPVQPPTPQSQNQGSTSKQEDLRKRLLALKAQTNDQQITGTECGLKASGSEMKEKSLRLRARLAAEKRKYHEPEA